MNRDKRIAAIVLAAGGSSRLGQPKQLLPVDGQPLLSRTLDVVRMTSLKPRILVLGGYAEDILAGVNVDGYEVVLNADFEQGQATSLKAGLQALPATVKGTIVLLGDQPLVEPWLLEQLVAGYVSASHVAVRPRYAGGPGNPVLLGRELFNELLALEGDVGARDVLRRHRARITEIDHTSRNAPRDVDTMDDYAAFLLDWSASGAPDVPRHCQRCGAEIHFEEVHARLRPVCPECGFTYFFDPKIAVAVIIEIDGKIVLQQRTINPGIGKWTFPSGFVDRGEVVVEAAAREVLEEVGLRVDNLRLLNLYSEPGQTVTLVVYHTVVTGQLPSIGDESSDVRLFSPETLPELAFPRDADVVADWLAIHRT
ncbi:hypothetical protein BH24CHL1_BH24CHL1_01670 [soil metagenome]